MIRMVSCLYSFSAGKPRLSIGSIRGKIQWTIQKLELSLLPAYVRAKREAGWTKLSQRVFIVLLREGKKYGGLLVTSRGVYQRQRRERELFIYDGLCCSSR